MYGYESKEEAWQRALPVAERPRAVVELNAPMNAGTVQYIIPLPCGTRVATASDDSMVRVYATGTGFLEHEFCVHCVPEIRRAVGVLCALGGEVLASCGESDPKIVLCDSTNGERLGEVMVGRDDYAESLHSLSDGLFAAGTHDGDVVFYAHSGGRDVTETARITKAHFSAIRVFSACNGILVTAPSELCGEAVVWDVVSRERIATLQGNERYDDKVVAVDTSNQLIVAAWESGKVRAYSTAEDYNCVAVLNCLHPRASVFKIIDDDVLVSFSADDTVDVTRVSAHTVIARIALDRDVVNHSAILADGRLAVCGLRNAAFIAPPPAAASVFKAHGNAAFPYSSAAARVLATAKPLPPLQGSVARVVVGDLAAAVACRGLISARTSSASLAEWWAAHLLLMRAVQDGDIPATQHYEGKHDWWVDCVYAQAPKVVVDYQSKAGVLKCFRDACSAGVLKRTDGTLDTIFARQDLPSGLPTFREAETLIVSAVAQLFMVQAKTHCRLAEHMAQSRRFGDVQCVAQLINVVFGVLPLASAGVAGCAGQTKTAWGSVESTFVVESLMGIGVGSQVFVAESFVERFMRGTRDVFNESTLKKMPQKSRQALERAVGVTNMTMNALGTLAAKVVVDETTEYQVSHDVNAEDVGGPEDAAANPRPNDSTRDGCAVDEAVTGCVEASSHKRGDGANDMRHEDDGLGAANGNTARDSSEADVDGRCEPPRENFVRNELKILEKNGLETDAVSRMKTEQLSSTLAAYIVGYDSGLWKQFASIRTCLTEEFRKRRLHGRRLVGKYPLSVEAFSNIVMDALSKCEAGADAETDRHCIREFFSEISEARKVNPGGHEV